MTNVLLIPKCFILLVNDTGYFYTGPVAEKTHLSKYS